MPSSESFHSQESPQPKLDSPKPESRLTLNELSPEVKPFATHLSEYILSLCKKHGIESNLDTTNNTNLSQAVSDVVAMYIEKLPTDPSLMEDAKKLIQLQNRLTSVHEQNKIPEEQEGDLHLIDQSSPQLPERMVLEGGWKIEKHVGEGIFELDPSKLQLYYSLDQKENKSISGQHLMKKMEINEIPVLNAPVLDYLFAHPEIIPEEWKTAGNIYFWNTTYRSAGGFLCVRCLYWGGGVWHWGCGYLGNDWSGQYPAAMLASVS